MRLLPLVVPLALALPLLPRLAHGEEVGSQAQPIVNGETTAVGQWPDATAITYPNPSAPSAAAPRPEGGCSAVLIAPDVVLTAGHCILISMIDQRALRIENRFGPDPSRAPIAELKKSIVDEIGSIKASGLRADFAMDVALNSPDIGISAEKIAVRKWVLHPNYHAEFKRKLDTALDGVSNENFEQRAQTFYGSLQTMRYDFAIMFLEQPSRVAPRKLATAEQARTSLVAGMTLTAVGYGTINATASELDGRQRQLNVRLVSPDCRGNPSCLEGGELTVSSAPGQSVCRGDSGGPLYALTAAGPIVVGITSRFETGAAFDTDRPCTGASAVIYGRPDSVMPWIDETVRDGRDSGGGCGCRASDDQLPAGAALWAALFGLLLWRTRRQPKRAKAAPMRRR